MLKQDTFEEILDPEALSLPEKPEVIEIRHQPYVDHLGDDALWVRVVFADGTTREDRNPKALRAIRLAIGDALLEAGIELFPYIWFATQSELEEAGIEI